MQPDTLKQPRQYALCLVGCGLGKVLWLKCCNTAPLFQSYFNYLPHTATFEEHGCINLGFSRKKLFLVESRAFHCRPFTQFFLELSRLQYRFTASFCTSDLNNSLSPHIYPAKFDERLVVVVHCFFKE